MGENSEIEWTHHTFNPWIGCTKVSSACDNCYAETWDNRFKGGRWGPHAERTRTAKSNWSKPFTWNDKARKDKTRRRVFCASLADVFDNHKSVQSEWRTDLWRMIKFTPYLDWLLLTKRPQNIEKYLPDDWKSGYPNVWLGTTAENQEEANRRIPHLLRIPAVVRFLSCEPLLGPLNLSHMDIERNDPQWCQIDCLTGRQSDMGRPCEDVPTIHWVIAGGESGPNARPMHPDWVRALRDQCSAASVPFFFKQWGSCLPGCFDTDDFGKWCWETDEEHCDIDYDRLGRGGLVKAHEREFIRFGHKKTGRRLDYEEHSQYPAGS